jgi:hypothetical protein
MSMPKIDLAELLNDLKQVKYPDQFAMLESSTVVHRRPETQEERQSRLRQQEWTTKVKLGKDIIISLAALAAGGIVVYICLNIILNPNAGTDDKKWATSLVASVASGLVGYLTGKASQ